MSLRCLSAGLIVLFATILLSACGSDNEKNVAQLELQLSEGGLSTGFPSQYRYVIARVLDAEGQPLVNASVEFSTTLGSFAKDSLVHQQVISTSRGNAQGQGRGEARLRLYPAATAGSAQVSVFSNGQQRSVEVAIADGSAFVENKVVNQLGLSLSVSSLSVAGTGGQETTRVSIELLNANGDRVTAAIDDEVNLRVSLSTSPAGGELLRPWPNELDHPGATELELTTKQGLSELVLTAGTLPGVIELLVEYLPALTQSEPIQIKSSPIQVASGPAHSIVISYPIQNALTVLENGFYRRKAGLQVTDRYGNAVKDGTVVNLGVLDTVLTANVPPVLNYGFAQTTLHTQASKDAGHSVLFDSENSLFKSAYVMHNNIQRYIEPDDRVLLLNSQAQERSRFVQQVHTDNLVLNAQFSESQTDVHYLVGTALKGIQVMGENAAGALMTGGTVTENGNATFYLTYPANSHTLGLGCIDPELDTRYNPVGSAQVWLIAQVSNTDATVLDNNACFSALLDLKLTNLSNVTTLSASGNLLLEVTDASDIRLAFRSIQHSVTFAVNEGNLQVEIGDCEGRLDTRTNKQGRCHLPVSITGGQSGDEASLQLAVAGGNSITLLIRIP